MDGFERITGREHEELVEKCQENGWLKVGGFDWQDDPFLEEYPTSSPARRASTGSARRWARATGPYARGSATATSRSSSR